MALWGDIAQGGLAAYGYNELMGDVRNQQDDMNQALEGLQSGVDERLGFTPWGVTSGTGNVQMGANGDMSFNLNPMYSAMQEQLGQGAGSMFSQALASPWERQQQLYDQMSAARAPGFTQQRSNMNTGLFNRGRSGMQTATYGGAPEQYAFAKAMGDAQASDWLQAGNQAMQEQNHFMGLGQSALNNSFVPQTQLGSLMNYGINNRQLNDQRDRELASLWTQLGMGGLTANTNFNNIRAGMFGDMINAASPAVGALGDAASPYIDAGMGWLSGLIGL